MTLLITNKNCPFCGVKGILRNTYDDIKPKYYVECIACGARTRYCMTEKEALDAWYLRVEKMCEIVRCCECKRMREWTLDEINESYNKSELADGWCMFFRIGTYNDFFCAWGVKRKNTTKF